MQQCRAAGSAWATSAAGCSTVSAAAAARNSVLSLPFPAITADADTPWWQDRCSSITSRCSSTTSRCSSIISSGSSNISHSSERHSPLVTAGQDAGRARHGSGEVAAATEFGSVTQSCTPLTLALWISSLRCSHQPLLVIIGTL